MPNEISDLPITNYEQSPRNALRLVGERTFIRAIDAGDFVDMTRMKEIHGFLNDCGFFPKESLTDSELIGWVKDCSPKMEGLLFGIGGKDAVTFEEKGELQGWVYVYPVESSEVKELRRQNIMIPPVERGQQVFMLSYIKYPDAASGQIASGVRQVCNYFGKLNASFHAHKQEKFEERLDMLKKEGQLDEKQVAKRHKQKQLHFNKPRQIIIATVSPRNQPSISVLEKSGFVKKGEIAGTVDPTLDPIEYVYLLDWDILNKKTHDLAELERKKTPSAT